MREVKLLKHGWKFRKEDIPDAVKLNFDDSEWESVRIPHDWAIKGPFSAEHDVHVVTIEDKTGKKQVDFTGETGGLPHVGKAWYRIKFHLPPDIKTKRLGIEFDGVMSHSNVYCNEKFVGTWPYGYSSFVFDITDFVNPGENLLAVFVDNKPNASRWYPGAGIYRNVRLVITNPVNVAHWGTYITTPFVSKEKAKVNVKTTIENHTGKIVPAELETVILDSEGNEKTSTRSKMDIGKVSEFQQELTINSPELWDIESPALYTARSIVKIYSEIIDCYDTVFGIRSIEFHPKKGFFLNGKHVKFQGVCLHHDLGPLGAAVNKSALKRQLMLLKEMGCNAIRTSHNPPAPELLELTDEMGFLVIDEAFDEWKIPKRQNGYHIIFDQWAEKDLRAMIRRDRNHPSVIMWSIGNEIPEQKDPVEGPKLAKFLHNICKEEDPSRPTTSAFNMAFDAVRNGLAEIVDIPGWNYQPHNYGKLHQLLPKKPMFGSETASCLSSRGEYYFPVEEERGTERESLQVNSFDFCSPTWGTIPDFEFRAQDEHPFIMGEFVWTGFDYLGEPNPYFEKWPSRSSYFGIIDLAGIPKDRFYLYQSKWASKKTLHIVPHWTWHGYEGKPIFVQCYSSWDTVELFVNGVSQGIREKCEMALINRYRLVWNHVVYEPGQLKAVAYDKDGNIAKEVVVYTAGKPAAIGLVPDRTQMLPDGEDMVFICADVIDEKGNLCPFADNVIGFSVEGPGEIVATDNGDPTSIEPFHSHFRKAFHGRCMVCIRSTGKRGTIKIFAESQGLRKQQIDIIVK
ncbi:MAG TPA: beta-galactosidase GalB [bacterium]|nr:beta-galactosidase GalB [bacterium]HOL35613.1 beta-galactosidase GalB [bacterium]HPO52290.1 beta-galactosidase GalB [bacterium]